ncbi:F0F1 ATP synthase subunit delta, partial [Shinella sp.]
MPVADTSQLVSGVAERYASSLFDLAQEAGSADSVGVDLDRFQALIDESD